VCERRENKRKSERYTQRDIARGRAREVEKERDRQRKRETERERERDRQRKREIDRERESKPKLLGEIICTIFTYHPSILSIPLLLMSFLMV
jgi:hypothetical protein